jgi:hypothetical protein
MSVSKTVRRVHRKKAAAPVAAPKPRGVCGFKGPESRGDEGLYLAREDLLFIELRQAKVANALQAIALRRVENERLLRRQEQERNAAQVEMALLTDAGMQAEARIVTMWAELGEVYGLDFTQVSYDDETGRITVHSRDKGSTDG